MQLLDTELYPQLLHLDVIVECHDHLVQGATEFVRASFAETHDVMQIACVPRRADKVFQLPVFTTDERMLLVDEMRDPSQQWLICTRR